MKKNIYILDARRTAIASAFKGMKDLNAAQMAGVVVKEMMTPRGIEQNQVDEVIFGNAVAAGTGQNLARQVVVLAGLPIKTPAYVVNAVCGSGLQAVILTSRSILAQEADLVVAGGTESTTWSPYLVSKDESDFAEKHDSSFHDGLLCAVTNKVMGELCEGLASAQKIKRADQDHFACKSHQKASAACTAGRFKGEIVPAQTARGIFDQDERPRQNLTMSRLAALPPAFGERGTITAGNSSAPADGACAFLLASESFVKKNKSSPIAKMIGCSSVALEPEAVFTGAIQAVWEVLKQTGLTIKDIDLFEVTESFAAQAIYTQKKLNIPDSKMNIYGGDLALGHPLGAAGARTLVTLVHALKTEKKRFGLSCVCFGGGGSIAVVVENPNYSATKRKKQW